MRLTASLGASLLLAFASAVALAAPSPSSPLSDAPASSGATDAEKPKDLLGNMVVVASAARALPKIGVVPSLAPETEDVTLRSVVRNDLDLCGEFEVLAEDQAPKGIYLSDSPVDTTAWGKKGAEAVVRVSAKREGDHVELTGQAYLVKTGQTPVLEKKTKVLAADLRTGAHRMADLLIFGLTGKKGAFASRMTFASGTGKLRRVYSIDADGHNAKAISPDQETALAPAFGKDNEIYYASSAKNAEYRLRSEKGKDLPLSVKGSVYGFALDKSRGQVAVSVGSGAFIRLLSGPDLNHLTPASDKPFAMEPTFTPSGKLAYVGLTPGGQRVFVGDKPVTPEGAFAMSPTFCDHPDGIRLVFAAGALLQTDLFASGETGSALVRLTQDQGKNSSPACSPDGRLIAFFSTRTTGDGPGLYVMRTDGLRPKRISPLAGDSLQWDALPQEPAPSPDRPQ